MKPKCRYIKRKWLNKADSEATGSVVAFDGTVDRNGRVFQARFLEISDCHGKISLHDLSHQKPKRFIKKLRLLAKTASDFADYLESGK